MARQDTSKVKQPPILFDKTQALVRDITRLLAPLNPSEDGTRLVTYFNNPRGGVCDNDVVALYEILEKCGMPRIPQSSQTEPARERQVKQETIYLFIKSDGGNGQASLRIVNLLRQYCTRLVALVPLECASAATMIALGADEILMGPMAYLTSVDTSLTHDLSPVDRDNDRVSVSLDELTRVIGLWRTEQADSKENAYKTLFQYVHPLVIGAVDRAESLSIMLCKELLGYHIQDENTIEQIARTLNSRYPSHSFPILFEEARAIGLKVSRMPAEINTRLLELNAMYSEMGQKATTDFDEIRTHSNEILNICESAGIQVYYQQDKDWFYRTEERRWITLNDNSSWRRIEDEAGRIKKTVLHIA